MQITGLKHAFLSVQLNGAISDSFMVLPVYLFVNRANLLMKMLGGHVDQLVQTTSLLIALQEHVLNIVGLFVLSGMRINQRVMGNV